MKNKKYGGARFRILIVIVVLISFFNVIVNTKNCSLSQQGNYKNPNPTSSFSRKSGTVIYIGEFDNSMNYLLEKYIVGYDSEGVSFSIGLYKGDKRYPNGPVYGLTTFSSNEIGHAIQIKPSTPVILSGSHWWLAINRISGKGKYYVYYNSKKSNRYSINGNGNLPPSATSETWSYRYAKIRVLSITYSACSLSPSTPQYPSITPKQWLLIMLIIIGIILLVCVSIYRKKKY